MIETTEDIDFEAVFKNMGCEFKWNESPAPWLGVDWEFSADRVIIKSVVLDSPAHKAGLNAQDEMIFLNGYRFLKEDADKIQNLLMIDQPYEFIISRLGKLERIEVIPGKSPRQLKEITIVDRNLAEKSFGFPEGQGNQELLRNSYCPFPL